MPSVEQVELSEKERAVVKRLAEKYGMSEDDVIQRLAQGAIAARVRRRTGKNPGRVYPLRGPKGEGRK